MVSLRRSREFVTRVAELLEKGISYKEIARELKVCESTVNRAISAYNSGLKTTAEYDEKTAREKGFNSSNQRRRLNHTIKRMHEKHSSDYRMKLELMSQKDLELLELEGVVKFPRQYSPGFNQSQSDLLMAEIDSLPDREREVLIKRLEGYTLIRIAQEYGIARQCIDRIVHRAIGRLKERLILEILE